ncbi:hypothetical protein CcaCcLH18_09035 [Colletotrichum camelliae]|nr:hypothetical protein CcaCcLH18_09035 [Colletotrichum camelliae]
MKRSFVIYKNMSEVLAHNEVVNRFSGHHIPPDWLQWQATYLTLIPSLINDPEEPAQLVRSGCTIDGQVNCRKACGNSTSMFSDSDTLWNCLTLATVSLRTDGADGKDEVNSENVTEIDNVFQVGDFSTFGFPFTSYSACMEDSCSDLEFGDCSRGTNKLLKSPINNTGIENLSKILQKEYCRHVNVGIDFDIAGPGIAKKSIPDVSRLLAEQGDELANTYNMSNWSFGQFVAVAVWFPIMSKFVSYIVVGIIDSLEKRLLDGRYRVTQKEHRETKSGSNHEDQNQETDPGSNDEGQSPENRQEMSTATVTQDREKTKTIEMEQGTFSELAGRTSKGLM